MNSESLAAGVERSAPLHAVTADHNVCTAHSVIELACTMNSSPACDMNRSSAGSTYDNNVKEGLPAGRSASVKGASLGGLKSSSAKKYIGVRQRPSGRWVAEIKDCTQKIRLWLGTFDTAEQAARAYDEAARMLRGANTRTNFSQSTTLSSSQSVSSSSAASSSSFPVLPRMFVGCRPCSKSSPAFASSDHLHLHLSKPPANAQLHPLLQGKSPLLLSHMNTDFPIHNISQRRELSNHEHHLKGDIYGALREKLKETLKKQDGHSTYANIKGYNQVGEQNGNDNSGCCINPARRETTKVVFKALEEIYGTREPNLVGGVLARSIQCMQSHPYNASFHTKPSFQGVSDQSMASLIGHVPSITSLQPNINWHKRASTSCLADHAELWRNTHDRHRVIRSLSAPSSLLMEKSHDFLQETPPSKKCKFKSNSGMPPASFNTSLHSPTASEAAAHDHDESLMMITKLQGLTTEALNCIDGSQSTENEESKSMHFQPEHGSIVSLPCSDQLVLADHMIYEEAFSCSSGFSSSSLKPYSDGDPSLFASSSDDHHSALKQLDHDINDWCNIWD